MAGTPTKEHGIIDLPLAPDPMNRPFQVVDHEHGKRAITEYRVLQTGSQSLLALYPHTGRTHQLRMHCAHSEGLGCPIVGDELYGQQADRLYLQAQAITFIHPTTGKRMHFELPYPFEHFSPININSQNKKFMVKHIILWTLNPELSEEEKKQVKAGIKAGLEGLVGKVPGLIDVKVHIDGRLASSNADVMLDSTLESEEALKGYAVHPEHVAVANGKVRPYTVQRSCLDFEI